MVTQLLQDGPQPSPGWSKTWSPIDPRFFTQLPKESHPPSKIRKK